MAEKKHPVGADDSEQALAHMALRGSDGEVIFSRDRKCSLMRDSDADNPRWSFYRSFESSVPGFDDMLEFVNWCGEREIRVIRNHTVPMTRCYGIMGWITKTGVAEEFRLTMM